MNIDRYLLLNLFLIAFESVMTAYLSSCFFRRKKERVAYCFSVCVLIALSILCFWILGNTPVVKLIIGIFLHTIWIYFIFRTTIIKSFFVSSLLLSYWGIVDSLFLMAVSSLMGNDYSILKTPNSYYFMCFSAKIMELLILIVIGTLVKQRFQLNMVKWKDWLRIVVFPLASLLISIELLRVFYITPESSKELCICASVLLLADVMSVFLLDYMEKQNLAIRDNAILHQNLKIEEESVISWVGAYRDERKRTHDFQNQLAVLRGMIADNTPNDSFIQYLDSLLNNKLPETRYINTNRPVADVLISQKAALAKSKGIQFQMQLDDMSFFPLPDDELVVVLANLLDNALEACEKVSKEAVRYVLLKVQCQPDVSYLYIENPTVESVIIKNNRVIKPRSKIDEHGFGLQNISTILDRHEAIYSIAYDQNNGIFSFTTQISAE